MLVVRVIIFFYCLTISIKNRCAENYCHFFFQNSDLNLAYFRKKKKKLRHERRRNGQSCTAVNEASEKCTLVKRN